MKRLAVLPALALACAAQAQTPGSVNDFQLPAGAASKAPAAGPVDPENPVPPRELGEPSPTPPQTGTPPALSVPPAAVPVSRATSEPQRRQRPSAMSAAPPVQGPGTAPSYSPAIGPEAFPAPAPVVAVPQPARPSPIPASAPQWPLRGPLWAAGGALALLLAGAAAYLSRRPRSSEPEADEEVHPLPAVEPARASPLPPPSSAPAVTSATLELSLEPQRMTRALVNATLTYRLSLTNRGATAVGPLIVASDIISAHASRSAGEQLRLDCPASEPAHRLASLSPGESVTLTGELRLPLSEVRAVRSGTAHLLVPLARFRVETAGGDGPSLAGTWIFVIGESPDRPGGKLRPFRLDDGPRVFSHLAQREVTVPA